MTTENTEKAKKIVKEFFEKTSFNLNLETLSLDENTLSVKIKTEEPRHLIGQNGQTLAEIQKLLKIMLRRQIQEDFYVDVDVNDYKKKKIEYLKETAREIANEVVLTGKEKILNPMPSYERRIVHMELANRDGIITESVGQNLERRIIVKPVL